MAGTRERALTGHGDRVDTVLDRDNGFPLYQQLVALLSNRIRSGAIAVGDYLPGEHALCAGYGVSRITARRALDELARAGLVARERGRGTRVLANRLSPIYTASLDDWRENVDLLGRSTSVQVLEFDYVEASVDIARSLGLAPGASVQRTVRVRRLGDVPFSHLTTHVPEAVGRCYRREDLARHPLHRLLGRAGVHIASVRQTLTATLAEPPVSRRLDVPVGSPLIEVERVVRDDAEQPVQFIRVRYRPDLYRFAVTMNREPDRPAPPRRGDGA